jgi:hypothetical protein
MRNRSVLITIGLLVAASGVASAQVRQIESDNTAYGTTAAEFLLLAPTARGAALGNSFAALTTDISSLHYNPAGLSQMARPELTASQTSYLADTKYSWLGLAFPFGGGARAFGVQIGSFGFADQPVYTVEDPTGTSGEVYGVAETVIGLTYSQQFSDRFAAGFTGKFVSDKLGGVTGNAFALDFGTSFHANIGGRPIRAAFTVQNLGTSLKHTGNTLNALVNRTPPEGQQGVPQEPAAASLRTKEWQLPIQFRVALAYDLLTTAQSRFSLMGEFTQPNNNNPNFSFAGEYNVNLGTSGFSLAPRLSYTYQPANSLDPAGPTSATYAGFDSTVKSGAYGLGVGGGIMYRKNPRGIGFGADYGYRSFGLLGGVNTISVSLGW